jgi:hypothetical protein
LAINFDADELDLIDANSMVLQRYNPSAYSGNGAWADFIPAVDDISNGPTLFFIQTGAIPSSEFYRSWAISSSTSPLPISLIRFNAICIGNDQVELSWSTASEINNDYFTVERSEDGIIWEAFDVVPGAGNSSTQLNYKVIDNNPFSGLTYYRLTQTDFDGTSETFDPEVSDCDGVGFEIVAANSLEASPILNLVVSAGSDERFDIVLHDMSGKQVLYQGNVMLYAGLNYLNIDKGDLGKGIYIISMVSETQVMTRRVLLD